MDFKVGDKVRKIDGYAWQGTIVMKGDIPGTGLRFLVRQDDIYDVNNENQKIAGGALHIFSAKQLTII